jgi:hypothetical protein
MSRSTKIEDLDDEVEVIGEQENGTVPSVPSVPSVLSEFPFKEKSTFETFKEYVIKNLKEILLVMSVVMLSNNKQISSFINSFKLTDNEYLLLLLKALLSGGLFVSGKLLLI